MEILVSNDDGIHSAGLEALAAELSTIGRVTVVAPDRERSAVSHSLSLHTPLRLKTLKPGWHISDGTPADCVHLALHAVMDTRPDLLVAGINPGPNVGDDVTYSGTVGIAMEGALMGIPSLAVSLGSRSDFNFGPAARVATHLARMVLQEGLPERMFLNVNVPNFPLGREAGEIRLTRQGRRMFGSGIIKKTDPRGRDYYWIGGEELGILDGDAQTDVRALAEGAVSVTPLTTDLTAYDFLRQMQNWSF